MPAFRLPVRQLVEFLLRTGSIDSRFTGFDRANEGARIHRKLQKAAGEGYAAEVFLSGEREAAGIGIGRFASEEETPMPLLLSKALVAGMLSTPLPRIHPEAMPRPSRSPVGWGQDDRNGTQGRTKA